MKWTTSHFLTMPFFHFNFHELWHSPSLDVIHFSEVGSGVCMLIFGAQHILGHPVQDVTKYSLLSTEEIPL